MFDRARRSALALLCTGLLCGGCEVPAAPAASRNASTEPEVDEHLARKRAVEHCRRLFKGLYWKAPLGGDLLPFPEIEADYFSVAEAQEHAWLLSSRRMAGMIIVARVAKRGDLVEVTSWEFATR